MSTRLDRQPWTAHVHVACTNALLRMPPRAAIAALDAAGLAIYVAVGARRRSELRRAYDGYAEVTGTRVDARAMTREFWRTRTFRRDVPALVRWGSEAFARDVVRVSGWEHVAAALDAGRGVVIPTVHTGCGPLPAAWAARNGAHVLAVRSAALARHVGTARAPHLFYGTNPTLVNYGATGGVETGVLKRGLDHLRAGGVVSALVDHHLVGRNVGATMFGAPVAYRSGFLETARVARAPVIAAFARASRAGIRIDYQPGIVLTSASDITAFVQRFAALHEELLRTAPAQLSFVGFETQLFCPWAMPSLNRRFGRF